MGKKLALFFSFRISLRDWHELGLIEREVSLYNKLSKHFEKIYFFTYGDSRDKMLSSYLSKNIEIIPVPFIHKGGRKGKNILVMMVYSVILPLVHWRILRKVDILKTNQISGSWTALITKLIFSKKLILRCGYIWSYIAFQNKENVIKRYIKRLLERITCVFADLVVCSSISDKKYLNNNYGIKAKIIPNYVDTGFFKPLGRPKLKNSVCFVGRLEREKNLLTLLEALKGLPYRLTIIGSGSMRAELEEEAQKYNVNVRFMNNVPHSKLPEILNQHEIFMLPSFYEGTPKALLEAMACGLAVIGTNVKGINEIIEHRKNGILSMVDSKSIGSAIQGLMEDEFLKNALGAKSVEKIRKEYALNMLVEQEKKIIDSFFV
ncbi:MAG: glycosyltransferase family 4 protein [Candidatus Omnitrophica bacterium]|nr:glycosyltransferase family 4 protein [Candidatus Omnitrophota bacterium]